MYIRTYIPEPETGLVAEDTPVKTTDLTTEVTGGEVTEAVVAGDVTNKFTSTYSINFVDGQLYLPCNWLFIDELCMSAVATPLAVISRSCS